MCKQHDPEYICTLDKKLFLGQIQILIKNIQPTNSSLTDPLTEHKAEQRHVLHSTDGLAP
jgi:hypothetical protein